MSEDIIDQWQDAIDSAHPTITGKHKTYSMALEMVSNRHSKGALVALVNWLLAYRQPSIEKDKITRAIEKIEGLRCNKTDGCRDVAHVVHNEAIDKCIKILKGE